MSIIRVNKTEDHMMTDSHYLRSEEISLKAKGLLSHMLSLPDGYNCSVSDLVAAFKDGRTSVQNGLKELEKAGYLIRTRVNGKNGRFRYDYEIRENLDEIFHKLPQNQNEDNEFEVEYSVVDDLSYLDTNKDEEIRSLNETIRCLQERFDEKIRCLQEEEKSLQAEIRRLQEERKKR